MSLENLPISVDTFSSASHTLVDDKRFEKLLGRFGYTYQFKRQFPWLAEGNPRRHLSGLPAAIEAALTLHRLGGFIRQPMGEIAVTDQFRTDLHDAFNVIGQDHFVLGTFSSNLVTPRLIFRGDNIPILGKENEWRGFLQVKDKQESLYGLPEDLRQMTVEQMRKEIALSLQTYWQNHNQGNASDPW